MAKNIAINGFGRIGKTFLRTILQDEKARSEINVVAVNVGPCFFENQDHFFEYDCLMGTFPGEVSFNNNILTIDGHDIRVISESDPSKACHIRQLKCRRVFYAPGKEEKTIVLMRLLTLHGRSLSGKFFQ